MIEPVNRNRKISYTANIDFRVFTVHVVDRVIVLFGEIRISVVLVLVRVKERLKLRIFDVLDL